MADDKTKTEAGERLRVAGSQTQEVEELARETGRTPAQARELIKRYGNDRAVLVEHAARFRSGEMP